MNWDQVKGNWKQFKGEAKRRWGKLTDDDLKIIAGDKDKLIGTLQERYGRTKEDLEREVNEFCADCQPVGAVSGTSSGGASGGVTSGGAGPTTTGSSRSRRRSNNP